MRWEAEAYLSESTTPFRVPQVDSKAHPLGLQTLVHKSVVLVNAYFDWLLRFFRI